MRLAIATTSLAFFDFKSTQMNRANRRYSVSVTLSYKVALVAFVITTKELRIKFSRTFRKIILIPIEDLLFSKYRKKKSIGSRFENISI
jgi:hypothetical protein